MILVSLQDLLDRVGRQDDEAAARALQDVLPAGLVPRHRAGAAAVLPPGLGQDLRVR